MGLIATSETDTSCLGFAWPGRGGKNPSLRGCFIHLISMRIPMSH